MKFENYNPPTAVDVIVFRRRNAPLAALYPVDILLIERKNPPYGWALPGGFQEKGDTLKKTAIKEVFEETGVDLSDVIIHFAGINSDPNRDPRGHTNSAVFYASVPFGTEILAGDDAVRCEFFSVHELPELVFDHEQIIRRVMDGNHPFCD